MRTLCYSLFMVSLAACSPAPMSPILSVEYIPPETQALDDIAGTSKSFLIPVDEDEHAQERVELFLRDYASGVSRSEPSVNSDTIVFSNRAHSGASYIYEVERTRVAGGFQYIVFCEPRHSGASDDLADRNARNFARFIRDGHLEVSLLARQ